MQLKAVTRPDGPQYLTGAIIESYFGPSLRSDGWFTKRLERGRAGSTSPNRRELPRHTFSFLGLVSPSLTLHLGNPRRPSIVFLMSVVRVKSDKCASNVRSGAILETTLKIRIND
jgi:hypothetical protein